MALNVSAFETAWVKTWSCVPGDGTRPSTASNAGMIDFASNAIFCRVVLWLIVARGQLASVRLNCWNCGQTIIDFKATNSSRPIACWPRELICNLS
jgi:hypothetical protein